MFNIKNRINSIIKRHDDGNLVYFPTFFRKKGYHISKEKAKQAALYSAISYGIFAVLYPAFLATTIAKFNTTLKSFILIGTGIVVIILIELSQSLYFSRNLIKCNLSGDSAFKVYDVLDKSYPYFTIFELALFVIFGGSMFLYAFINSIAILTIATIIFLSVLVYMIIKLNGLFITVFDL